MADSYVPPAMARVLAERIPGSNCFFREGAGHLMVIDCIGDVIDRLCRPVDH